MASQRKTSGHSGELAARLRELRNAKGYSQVELADAAGVSPGYIGLIETGHRGGRPEKIRKFASVLGLTSTERAELLRLARNFKPTSPEPQAHEHEPSAAQPEQASQTVEAIGVRPSRLLGPLLADGKGLPYFKVIVDTVGDALEVVAAAATLGLQVTLLNRMVESEDGWLEEWEATMRFDLDAPLQGSHQR